MFDHEFSDSETAAVRKEVRSMKRTFRIGLAACAFLSGVIGFSAGMLAGSVLLGLWGGTRNKIITMTAAVLGLGLTLVLAGLLPPSGFRAFAGLSLLMGLSAPFFNSVFMALIQTKVEPKYLGRVLGLTGAIMTLASPLGLGLTALFADATGVPLWFLLAGAITLTCGGLMLLLPSVRTCGRP